MPNRIQPLTREEIEEKTGGFRYNSQPNWIKSFPVVPYHDNELTQWYSSQWGLLLPFRAQLKYETYHKDGNSVRFIFTELDGSFRYPLSTNDMDGLLKQGSISGQTTDLLTWEVHKRGTKYFLGVQL